MKNQTRASTKKLIRAISKEELIQLFENTYKMKLRDLKKGNITWPRRWILIHLPCYAGLRRAEIAALKVDAIVFNEKPVIIVQNGKGNKRIIVRITNFLAGILSCLLYTSPSPRDKS